MNYQMKDVIEQHMNNGHWS